MGFNAVPDELKRRDQWVCWKLEKRNERKTKIPYSPATGERASSTDSSTWGSFDMAIHSYAMGQYSGIGFALADDRVITGIDLDHVLHEGIIDERVRWIVEQANTYCEISPSGDGLHLFLMGAKPDGFPGCKTVLPDAGFGTEAAIEVYDHSRYFTVTGNTLGQPLPVNPNPKLLEQLRERFWEPKNEGQLVLSSERSSVPVSLSDNEIIWKMIESKKGAAIKALLDGDTSAYDGDESAADMALCNHLAFWCGCEKGQMDRIFRTSGLMRPKWDELHGTSKYGEMTLQKAVESCWEIYDPTKPTITMGVNNSAINPPIALEPWELDPDYRLWKCVDGKKRMCVTATPPLVLADVRDIDSGHVRALVSIPLNDGVKEFVIERSKLSSSTEIVKALSPLGATISSANSRDVVAFLTDMENAFSGSRKQITCVSHLGWADGPLGRFMPYDQDGEFHFNPEGDFAEKAQPFLKSSGTLEDWRFYIGTTCDAHPAVRALVAASFASPLVPVLSVQTFMVYIWGMSRSGKTPSLKAAASIWGDPSERPNSYYHTFADTPKALIRYAAFLHDIPVIIDELQSKGALGGQDGKRKAVEDLIYALSLGHEREGLNSDRSIKRSGSWRSLTIATGEIPVIGSNTQQGAANRVLEINAEPFEDPQEAGRLHEFLASNYGTAGKIYITKLRQRGSEWLKSRWKAFRAKHEELVRNSPQANGILLLGFADALANLLVFEKQTDWDSATEDSSSLMQWLCDHTPGFEDGDTDLKAIQFLSAWLYQNYSRFERKGGYQAESPLGFCEDTGKQDVYFVLSKELGSALNDAGFDRTKTLRKMDSEGLLALPEGHKGFTVQRRRGLSKPPFVPIKIEALSNYLEKADSLTRVCTSQDTRQDDLSHR